MLSSSPTKKDSDPGNGEECQDGGRKMKPSGSQQPGLRELEFPRSITLLTLSACFSPCKCLRGLSKGEWLVGDCRTLELQRILEVMADAVSLHPVPLPLPYLCSKPDFWLLISAVIRPSAFSSHCCAFTWQLGSSLPLMTNRITV